MDYFREEGTYVVYSTSTHNIANVFINNEISKMGKIGTKRNSHQRINLQWRGSVFILQFNNADR